MDSPIRPSWTFLQVPTFRANAGRATDLNNDGFEDILLSSYEENSFTVVWGQRDQVNPPRIDQYQSGPGPIGAEPVIRDGTSNTLLVPRIGWEVGVSAPLAEVALFNLDTREFSQSVPLDPEAGRASLYTVASVPPAATGPNWYAIAWAGAHSGTSAACNSDVEPTVEIFTMGSTASSARTPTRFSNITLKRGLMNSMGAHLTGFSQNPWFVFSNPEDPIVEVAQPGSPETIVHTFGDPVLTMTPFPRATRLLDRAPLVVAAFGMPPGLPLDGSDPTTPRSAVRFPSPPDF